MKRATEYWYMPRPPLHLFLLSLLFRGLSGIRRGLYKARLLRSYTLPVPVIVVGNINVGGTGKTPLVIWLVELLQKAGYRPGIVTRGYGGKATQWPQQVRADGDPYIVGDEPILLAQRCDCPIVAAPDRVAAARALLKHSDCDILISDDGLQHYRLRRDVEIVVIDGGRRFGNGHCIPAGPLREMPSRLKRVDFIVNNGGPVASGESMMRLEQGKAVNLASPNTSRDLKSFKGKRLHALAGIGHPQRFFDSLKQRGIKVEAHPFPDHHAFKAEDLEFGDSLSVMMTEKDAVKCRRYAQSDHWWVPVTAQLEEVFARRLLKQVKQAVDRKKRR